MASNIYRVFSCLLLITSLKYSLSNDDVCCNLRIYEGVNATGKTLDYLKSPMAFKQAIAWMQLNELSGYSWICIIKGIFIFYNNPDYVAITPNDAKLYSGKGKCEIASPNGLGSIRHSSVAFWDPDTVAYITLFSGLYYSGSVRISIKDHGGAEIKGQGVRSFLTVGDAKWNVKAESGKEFCLVPYTVPNSDKVLFCAVPDVFEIMGDETLDLTWKQVDKATDCSGDQIELQNCFDYESGEAQGPAVNTGDGKENATTGGLTDTGGIGMLGGLGLGDMDSPFNETKDCGDYLEPAFLIRMHLTHNFKDSYQFLLPLNKTHSWRTELLDTTFDILTETGIVNDEPLHSMVLEIREYFVYILEKLIWSKGLGWPEHRPSHDLNVLVHETKECLGKLRQSQLVSVYRESAMEAYRSVEDLKIPKESIVEAFKLDPELDPLMEIVWLIFNMAALVCHEAKGYDTNHWMEYHVMVKELYLLPMKTFWQRDDDFHQIYNVVFGGIGIKLNSNLLAMYASVLYKRHAFVDIITRPDFSTETPSPAGEAPSPAETNAEA